MQQQHSQPILNLVDVHCHIDFPVYHKTQEWFKTFINTQIKSGVKAIVANSSSLQSNEAVLKLAREYEVIKPAMGLHPIHVHEVSQEEFQKLLDRITQEKPLAIGEVGLDFKEGKASKQEQVNALEQFFAVAKKLNVPIILHSRGAEFDIASIVESFNYKKTILHYFNGRKHLIKKLSEQGFYFSIPTNIVRLQHLQLMADMIPLQQLLTETDSPYLAPDKSMPFNEPRNVLITIQKIAEIKKLQPEQVAEQVFKNYKALF
ncbi:TatD family hydrolase, partial [Candidatus Woesearchaeota archaeon]|nr:TatD family hydrolase [Candidatus Woesearchaeota archaeon]